MKRQRIAIALGAIVLLALGVFARAALAHPIVVRTEPEQNAQLDQAPHSVRVFFNEPLEALSELQLFDAQGNMLAQGGRSPKNPAVLELTPPSLGTGVYTVLLRVVGSDGHLVTSHYVFRVGSSEATPEDAAEPIVEPISPTAVIVPADPPVVPAALLRGLMLLGALAAVGSWSFAAAVLSPALAITEEPVRDKIWRRWRTVLVLSLLLVLISTPIFAVFHTLHVAGRFDIASAQDVLVGTRFGLALVVRWLLALVALVLTSAGASGWWRWLSLVLGGALLATFAVSGHAAAQAVPAMPVLADWVHLVATALWVGGLVQFALVLPLLGMLSEQPRVAVLSDLIERFSPLALVSVLALAATGTYAALLHMSAVPELWTTGYGLALLAKIVLFGVLVTLGAYNMLAVRPRFRRWTTRAAEAIVTQRWQSRFARALRAEVVLVVLVVLAAGVLTSLSPATAQVGAVMPSGSAHEHVAAPTPTFAPIPSEPFDQIQSAADLRVRLQVTPASISANEFRVTVTDAHGAPVEAQLVRLELNMVDMEMGVTQLELPATSMGEYSASASPLSMVGEWRIVVLVRRADADDVRSTFVVPVGE